MPIIKSAIKRVKQSAKRRSHNLQVKRFIHNDIRAVQDAILTGDSKSTSTALRDAQSELDRAVKKGVLHKNTAARRKAQLAKQANSVISSTSTKAEKPAKKSVAKKPAAKASVKKPAKKPSAKKKS